MGPEEKVQEEVKVLIPLLTQRDQPVLWSSSLVVRQTKHKLRDISPHIY